MKRNTPLRVVAGFAIALCMNWGVNNCQGQVCAPGEVPFVDASGHWYTGPFSGQEFNVWGYYCYPACTTNLEFDAFVLHPTTGQLIELPVYRYNAQGAFVVSYTRPNGSPGIPRNLWKTVIVRMVWRCGTVSSGLDVTFYNVPPGP